MMSLVELYHTLDMPMSPLTCLLTLNPVVLFYENYSQKHRASSFGSIVGFATTASLKSTLFANKPFKCWSKDRNLG